jgi:predicted Rossmann-fold nucleotide-binding protein
MDLMITDDEEILCMTWVDLNIVQYMITMHTIDEMKEMTYKSSERRHGIFKSALSKSAKDEAKLSFLISIVEYNTHMRRSDGNAQQRSYYSSSQVNDSRY